jgi:hypothetical protein
MECQVPDDPRYPRIRKGMMLIHTPAGVGPAAVGSFMHKAQPRPELPPEPDVIAVGLVEYTRLLAEQEGLARRTAAIVRTIKGGRR